MPYKLCLLAAGRGSRLSSWETIHKGLLPVGNVAVISHIISKFPREVEIVIAVGYKSEQLQNFISLAHRDRSIKFVNVDPWQGPGSGPGLSLLACRTELQCPFIFTGIDTLVMESVPAPDSNWIGTAAVEDTKDFLMAAVDRGQVQDFYDKVDRSTLVAQGLALEKILPNAFIGMAGVKNWQAFWESLENTRHDVLRGELQVANGLRGLLPHQLKVQQFTWHDTGNDQSYEETRRHFPQVVSPKADEQLYIQDEIVIKFFADKIIADNRVARAKNLPGLVPDITGQAGQFYSYNKVPGQLISEIHNLPIWQKFLAYCQHALWQPVSLDKAARADFWVRCDKFYRVKTDQRVQLFHQENKIKDTSYTINGVAIPATATMLSQINWSALAGGTPTHFHGDLQPENIIVTPDTRFTLIDWRQDFAGLFDYGDVYYDLAKLDHALLVNGEMVRQNNFTIELERQNVTLEFYARSHLLDYRQYFDQFILDNGYSLPKVKLLSSLIFLNIAPLHHSPYNQFVYFLGKYHLYEALKQSERSATDLRRREEAIVG